LGPEVIKSAQSARALVRFGAFEVDFKAGELRKQGCQVKLQDQPFQVLQVLLEHPGEVVSREDLRQRVWPADTFVDFDQGLNNAIKRLREALSDDAENPQYIETVPRRGYRFRCRLEVERVRSLAVLPLENLSHNPEQEYFADGLTEALITTLAKLGELRVVARTSVMLYKGVRKPLRDIARELGADAIVEGTVLRAGQRVRITAQLIDAANETHLWAESYERDLRNVLALQAELAEAIAREVRVKLTPQEKAQLAQIHPVNPEAYEAFLKGRYHWNKRSPEGLKKSAKYFQQAIEKDPSYAAAYAGLADCADRAGLYGFVPPGEGAGTGKEVARKALELDDTLAEAHAALGSALLQYDYAYLASEKEFLRAIALNPGYATAHQWRGLCLSGMCRFDEALAETSRALQLDPLSPIMNVSHAFVLWLARKWDRAIESCQRAQELDPNYLILVWALANALQGRGSFEQAICERKRAIELSHGEPMFVAELSSTYAAAGHRKEALEILEQVNELSRHRYVMAYWMALIHTGLKEKDKAFRWLEKAYEERSSQLLFVKADPRWDYLRSDPRFDDLLRRMNFPK
jgi:TolB-like protein/Flp pilus assembly protein TadD